MDCTVAKSQTQLSNFHCHFTFTFRERAIKEIICPSTLGSLPTTESLTVATGIQAPPPSGERKLHGLPGPPSQGATAPSVGTKSQLESQARSLQSPASRAGSAQGRLTLVPHTLPHPLE